MRKTTVALLGALILGWTGAASAVVVDRLVAIVNNDAITQLELDAAFAPYQKKIDEAYRGEQRVKFSREGKLMMLNRMIDNRLVQQQAKKSGMVIKDDEVKGILDDTLKMRKMTLPQFTQELAKEGMSLEDYRKEVREQLLRRRLVRREVSSKIVVSDDEIGEYYKMHREDYEGKESVHVKQILIPIPRDVTPEEVEKVRAKVRDLQKKIASEPEMFDAAAMEFSRGPAAESGGDIGFIERGDTYLEVEAAAFALPPGKVSEVIETPVGLHIIKVLERRGKGQKTIQEVREEIYRKLETQKVNVRFEVWVKELRAKSHIEIKLP